MTNQLTDLELLFKKPDPVEETVHPDDVVPSTYYKFDWNIAILAMTLTGGLITTISVLPVSFLGLPIYVPFIAGVVAAVIALLSMCGEHARMNMSTNHYNHYNHVVGETLGGSLCALVLFFFIMFAVGLCTHVALNTIIEICIGISIIASVITFVVAYSHINTFFFEAEQRINGKG